MAGRVVQGLGAGAISAIIYVIIARGYDRAVQPRMIAIISSAWVIPGLVGPALAGYVRRRPSPGAGPSWPWCRCCRWRCWPWPDRCAGSALPNGRLGRRGDAAPTGGQRDRRGAPGSGRRACCWAPWARATCWSSAWPWPAACCWPFRRCVACCRPARCSAQPGRGAAVAVVGLVSIAFFGVEAFVPLAVSSIRNAGTVAGGLALAAAAVTWAAGSWVQARLTGRGPRRAMTGAGHRAHCGGHRHGGGDPGHLAAGLGGGRGLGASAAWGWALAYSTATLAIIETAEAGEEGAASAAVSWPNALGDRAGHRLGRRGRGLRRDRSVRLGAGDRHRRPAAADRLCASRCRSPAECPSRWPPAARRLRQAGSAAYPPL